jgi:cytochrome d ubiquinol oxidase subunit II
MSLDLQSIWFLLVGALLAGYAVLDGFDLGVGALHLFVKKDEERRVFLNAIGPVWDGNEVWLVTGGGALFAAFPEVYASVFSGFYLAIILVLFMLIFRAVAIEFRSKHEDARWRRFWDTSFSVASIGASFLFGVALGNVIRGIPLDDRHLYHGGFTGLLHPFALLVGAATVALFTMHGSIYLVLKTEGELHDRLRGWVRRTIILFAVGYVAVTMATLVFLPRMAEAMRGSPALFALPVLTMLAVANVPREIRHDRDFRAFLSSGAAVLGLMALVGVGLYPDLVPSAPDPANSLTIYNAASSERTLRIMLVIAAIGMPLVLAYTASIYYIFRGKVKLDPSSY